MKIDELVRYIKSENFRFFLETRFDTLEEMKIYCGDDPSPKWTENLKEISANNYTHDSYCFEGELLSLFSRIEHFIGVSYIKDKEVLDKDFKIVVTGFKKLSEELPNEDFNPGKNYRS